MLLFVPPNPTSTMHINDASVRSMGVNIHANLAAFPIFSQSTTVRKLAKSPQKDRSARKRTTKIHRFSIRIQKTPRTSYRPKGYREIGGRIGFSQGRSGSIRRPIYEFLAESKLRRDGTLC